MRKTIPLVLAALFILFAAFQYNDPDPQVWIAIYGIAALTCFMAYARVGRPWFYALMALIYVVAAVYQWPPQFEGFLLDELGMKTVNIELAREAGGLVICALAMGALALLTRNVASAGRKL